MAGGMLPLSAIGAEAASHWLIYFAAADCEAACARTKNRGATALKAPTEIEDAGRFAVLADPAGAAFAIFESA